MTRKYTPRGYQTAMMDHIGKHRRCALWVFMGAGKTVATLTALDALSTVDDDIYPVLVLAPLRVARSTWPDEVSTWEHLAHIVVSPITGNGRERMTALKAQAHIYTTNYEQLPWLVEQWGDAWPYKTVVLDEATRVKSFRLRQGGRRARALATVAHTHVTRLIELSGTPSPNGLQDLWGQAWFLDKGERLCRSFAAFTQRWFRPGYSGYGIVQLPHAQAEVQDKLRDVCLTIDAKDWFDLREPVVVDVMVDLPPPARKHYREMESAMYTEIADNPVEALNAAARSQKCLQLANGAAYIEGGSDKWSVVHDAKLDALDSIIEEAAGAPVLVAYQFKSDLARLKKRIPQARVLDASPQTVVEWNAGDIPVLLAHPASAGHGLSLQHGGNILVYFAVDWNLENHMQILERIGPVRQMQSGYDRNVFVYRIIARDTVDELVLERLTSKRSVQDILLDAMSRRPQ